MVLRNNAGPTNERANKIRLNLWDRGPPMTGSRTTGWEIVSNNDSEDSKVPKDKLISAVATLSNFNGQGFGKCQTESGNVKPADFCVLKKN
ncbi:Hypothetical protein CINCED_3A000582 [Cinara cedri]|uniref:Uncharacterized protein n=1 Tax=Cinara cedri TaxID=506608 RepID=A0A5E4M573_9HEMI|nr:Hypothetical protein CINCED_3A000582 [Cinara cedri]